jgi:hypothetical protein
MMRLLLLLSFISSSVFAQISSNGGFGLGSGTSSEQGNAIAVDPLGNTYIAGIFDATVDFDPSSGIYNLSSAQGNNDIYLAKYNSVGALLWAKSMGGSGDCRVFDIAADSSYVVVCGSFIGTTDFDPTATTSNKSSIGGGTYGDGYFAKFTDQGNLVFAHAIPSTLNDAVKVVTLDDSNNIYIAGFIGGNADMNPGAGTVTFTNSSTYWNTYFAKFNSAGVYQYARQLSGSGSNPYGLCLDKSGNVYLAGEFSQTVDFNPGLGTNNLTASGGASSTSYYLARYSNAGVYNWAKRNGGTGLTSIQSIAVDDNYNIYAAGFFSNSIDVDFGVGVQTYSSALGSGFVVKYDSATNHLWSLPIGGTVQFNPTYALALDGASNVYVTGAFNGSNVDFDGSASSTAYLSSTKRAAYLAGYSSTGGYLFAEKINDVASSGRALTYSDGKMYWIGDFADSANVYLAAGNPSILSNGAVDVFVASFNVANAPLSISHTNASAQCLPNNSVEILWPPLSKHGVVAVYIYHGNARSLIAESTRSNGDLQTIQVCTQAEYLQLLHVSDGDSTYSNTMQIKCSTGSTINIYCGTIAEQVDVPFGFDAIKRIRLIALNGTECTLIPLAKSGTYTIPSTTAPGIYFIRVEAGSTYVLKKIRL